MSPYRIAPPAEPDESADPLRSSTLFLLGMLALAALRITVALVSEERCGAEVGIAAVVLLVGGRAIDLGRS